MKKRLLLLIVVLIVGVCVLEIIVDTFLFQMGIFQTNLELKVAYHYLFMLGDVTLAVLIAALIFYRAFTRQERTLDELRAAHAKLTANHALLVESKNKFQKMTDNIPGGIYQLLMKLDGAISFPLVSEKCRQLIGVAPDAIQQDSALVLGFIHPGDRNSFFTTLNESARTLSPWHWEGRFLVCGTMKWLSCVAQPEGRSDGAILWDGMIIDVSDMKRVEHSLKQSKQMLQLVLDTIPSAVFWKDQDLLYLGCNRVFAQDVGLADPKDIVRKSDFDLVWKDHAPRYRADDSQVMETNTSKLGFEEPLIKADHLAYWTSTSKVPLHAPDGTVIGVLGTYEDITKRKRAVDEAYTILRMSMDGFYVVDKQGNILDANEAYCSMIGYSRAELIHLKLRDIEAAESEEIIAQHIKKILNVGYDRFETRHRCKDGRIIEIESSVNYVKGETGKFFAFIRDITERKRAEKEINESEQRFRAIFDNAADGILLVDTESKKLHLGNKAICEMLGYAPDQITTMQVADIHPAKDLTHVMEQFEKQARRELITANSLPVQRKDGSVIYADVSVFFLTRACARNPSMPFSQQCVEFGSKNAAAILGRLRASRPCAYKGIALRSAHPHPAQA
ncbi:MAG: PAS domain S-box protein, partial [Kiritimatiellae bacterium]|nr:PAS domain S-box protein [Kiritimatiellia bacterium]